MTRYNSREQEDFFNPTRLVVVKIEMGTHRNSYNAYRVLHWNPYTGETTGEKVWSVQTTGSTLFFLQKDEPKNVPEHSWVRAVFYSRKDAETAAKAVAIDYDLPYKPSKDYLEGDYLLKGKQVYCGLCGREFILTWEHKSYVCEKCRGLYALGKDTHQPTETAEINPHQMLTGEKRLVGNVLNGILSLMGRHHAKIRNYSDYIQVRMTAAEVAKVRSLFKNINATLIQVQVSAFKSGMSLSTALQGGQATLDQYERKMKQMDEKLEEAVRLVEEVEENAVIT